MKPQIFSNNTVVEWAKRHGAGEGYREIGKDVGRSAGNVCNIIHNRMKSHPELFADLKEAAGRELAEKKAKFERWGRLNTHGGMSFHRIGRAEGVAHGEALKQYRAAMQRWPEWGLPEPKINVRQPTHSLELAVRVWKRHGALRHWGRTAKEFKLPTGDSAARLCKKHRKTHPHLFPDPPEDPFAGLHPGTVEQAIRTRAMIQEQLTWPEIARALGKPKNQAVQCYRSVRRRDPENWPLPGNPERKTDEQGLRWARAMADGDRLARIAEQHGTSSATVNRAIQRALESHPEEARRLGNLRKRQQDAQRARRVAILEQAAVLQQDRSLAKTAAALKISPRTLQHWRREENFPIPLRKARPGKAGVRPYARKDEWPLDAWIGEIRAGRTMEQVGDQNGISRTRVSQLLNGHDPAALKEAIAEGRILRAKTKPRKPHTRRQRTGAPRDLDGWIREIAGGARMKAIGARHQITAGRVSQLLNAHDPIALRAALRKGRKPRPPRSIWPLKGWLRQIAAGKPAREIARRHDITESTLGALLQKHHPEAFEKALRDSGQEALLQILPKPGTPPEVPEGGFPDRTGHMSKETFQTLLALMDKRHAARRAALTRQLDRMGDANAKAMTRLHRKKERT